MPKYTVLAKSFIDNTLVEPGEVIEFSGKPGTNLELVKETKPKKVEEKQEVFE